MLRSACGLTLVVAVATWVSFANADPMAETKERTAEEQRKADRAAEVKRAITREKTKRWLRVILSDSANPTAHLQQRSTHLFAAIAEASRSAEFWRQTGDVEKSQLAKWRAESLQVELEVVQAELQRGKAKTMERLKHMQAALEHLKVAGQGDLVSQLQGRIDELSTKIQSDRESHKSVEMRQLVEVVNKLRAEMAELRTEVKRLKSER